MSIEALRGRGYRLTPQREMVWEILQSGHMSAEEVHARIARRHPNVNISTVYRTLELLVAEGLVREAVLGGERRMYEVAPAEQADHQHLVCTTCGGVEHLTARHLGALHRHLGAEHAFRADRMVLTAYGRCRRCAKGKR